MAQALNIIYKTLEAKYIDSLIECIIQTELQDGSFLTNMRINKTVLEKVVTNFLYQQDSQMFGRIMIGVDTQTDEVIACVVGVDLQDILIDTIQKQEDKVMDQYCAIQHLALKEIGENIKDSGVLMIVDSYGVRQQYQEFKIGQIILQKYLDYIETIGYIGLTGLCTSRVCLHICRKFGCKIGKSITPKELSAIDPSLSTMFKESIEIPMLYCKGFAQQKQGKDI